MNPAGVAEPEERELLDRLAALRTDGERRKLFRRRPELLRPGRVEALCAEVARLVSVDLERAAAAAAAARVLAVELGDERCRALAERAAAHAAHFAGASAEADELYVSAIERFLALGEEREAAIARSSALLNLAYLGDYDRVREWEEAAREVFERLDDRPRLAILEHNSAAILYRRDRWREALERYRLAYREFLALGRAQDVAVCLRNIAVCHISLHEFDRALEVYRRAREDGRAQGLERIVLVSDYNIAYLYYLRGEYTRAIRLFQLARRQCEAQGDEYHRALCDLDQAEIYLELNLVGDAERLAAAAFASFERLGMPYEKAKALTNRAIALSRQGKGAPALELLRRARDVFVGEGNRLWPALIDFYRAVVLYRQGRSRGPARAEPFLSEAVRLAGEAREVFAATAVEPRAAMCELLLAELHLHDHRPAEARASCHAALERLADLDLPALEHQAFLILGRVEEATGDPAAALDAYRRSLRRLEQLHSQLQGEDLKIAFLEDKQALFESLVWLTLGDREGGGEELAFGYIEMAKSRSLADLLAFRGPALPPRSEDDEVAARVRSLRRELNALYRRIDCRLLDGGEGARREVDRLRRSARRQERELLRRQRQRSSSDRELSSLRPGAAFDLATVRSSLAEGSLLLEYFIARGTVFAAVADRRRLEILPLTTARQARELHRFLQFQLAKPKLDSRHLAGSEKLIAAAVHSHLRQLHRLLVEPLAHLLDDPAGRTDHLVLVPHGFLHYVPFHALHDGDRYLIDRYSISYAPSASVFHLCAAQPAAGEDRSLVLGVADRRAPHILEEVRAVAEALPGATLLVGEAAGEEALRTQVAGCRFVHLATHALFRRDNPMFSAIQLGDSRLSLFDLYDLRLDAELVVLSGCGTGLNAVLGGEELVGLTRGLLYAGARSVLVTLWDVHDESTAEFMGRFYRHLADGAHRAQALRQAMRDLRRRYPSPYHWAPFVLVGHPG